MKIALCFIISYEHILNKEEIWKEWIEPNKDIINVYFFYKDIQKIKSKWILEHTIPNNYIKETSYFYVIPAYVSLMKFGLQDDKKNQWFCFLTDSCCPIISPKKFRYLFYKNYDKSIMSWKTAWWNVQYHKRANLALLPEELHLANDPWFVLKRKNVLQILNLMYKQPKITKTICNGGLANESLFAILLYISIQLNSDNLISSVTHITDWKRMSSPTSPYIFKIADDTSIEFIDTELEKNKYAIFLRKVATSFPDEILKYYIYEENKNTDDLLLLKEPIYFIYLRYRVLFFIICFIICLFLLFFLIKILFINYK